MKICGERFAVFQSILTVIFKNKFNVVNIRLSGFYVLDSLVLVWL